MINDIQEAFESTRVAGVIAAGALDEVAKIIKPGISTNQIDKITLTQPISLQKTRIEIGPITGSATYTLKVNGVNLTVASVTNTTDLINGITQLFDANQILKNNLTLTSTPTTSSSESSTMEFLSKLYIQNKFL